MAWGTSRHAARGTGHRGTRQVAVAEYKTGIQGPARNQDQRLALAGEGWLRGSFRSIPFFSKPPALKAFLLLTQATTYALALAFFETSLRASSTRTWFAMTYIGCVAVSAAISAISLFMRSSLPSIVLGCFAAISWSSSATG